jgi:hypothetical protein
MTSRLLIRAAVAGALGLLALDLAACGKQGVLDRPGPLFGSGSRSGSTQRAERAAAARASGESSAGATSGTSQTNGDYSQASDGAKDPALTPFRTNPPPGAPNPAGVPPSSGVIPNPFNDPNRVPR